MLLTKEADSKACQISHLHQTSQKFLGDGTKPRPLVPPLSPMLGQWSLGLGDRIRGTLGDIDPLNKVPA